MSVWIESAHNHKSSLFCIKTVNLVAHLSPAHSADIRSGVHQALSASLLMRYSKTLGGVPLSFEEKTLKLSPCATIAFDNPALHIPLSVSLLVFCPKAGMTIPTAIINAMSADHVGLLVFGVWNASVKAADLPSNNRTWNRNHQNFAGLHIGQSVSFLIVSVDHTNDILSFQGKIIFNENNDEANSSKKKEHSKNEKTQNITDGQYKNVEKSSKKSKRKIDSEASSPEKNSKKKLKK